MCCSYFILQTEFYLTTHESCSVEFNPEAQNLGSRLLSSTTGLFSYTVLFRTVTIWQTTIGLMITSSSCNVVDVGPSGEAVKKGKLERRANCSFSTFSINQQRFSIFNRTDILCFKKRTHIIYFYCRICFYKHILLFCSLQITILIYQLSFMCFCEMFPVPCVHSFC